MKTVVGVLWAVVCAGCVEDYAETSAQFMNGCDKLDVANTGDGTTVALSLKQDVSQCGHIGPGPVMFSLSGAGVCGLRGGVSDGSPDGGEPDSSTENPIEALGLDKRTLKFGKGDVTVTFADKGTYGFYCQPFSAARCVARFRLRITLRPTKPRNAIAEIPVDELFATAPHSQLPSNST